MNKSYKDKNIKILAVEPSAATRTLLVEVIRSSGFTDITGMSSLKEALEILEVEPVDWIITTLCASQDVNALNLLRLCQNRSELRHLNISLLVDDHDKDLLPAAYENGLFSHFHKPLTRDSFFKDLNLLIQVFENQEWDRTLTSAEYLRTFLSGKKQWVELLNFERRLLQLFPSKESLLFNTIQPLIETGESAQAKAVLKQIAQVLPAMKKEVESYKKRFFSKSDEDASEEGSSINILNIQKALIIENDDALREHIISHMKEMGVPEVIGFDNGQCAFDYIKQHDDVNIIIQEWRLPKISGPQFIQKLHEIDRQHIPIVILSSLVKKEDLHFIREFGVANLAEKPFERQPFTKALVWTIQQERIPTEVAMMERKIRNLLHFRERKEAEQIRRRFMVHPQAGPGKKQLIDAEFAFFDKEYTKTKELCLLALKSQGDSLPVLSLLGRTLMYLREFELALKCYGRAQSIVPQNIERLCQIAEIKSEIGDQKSANEFIDSAKAIDIDSEVIKETEAKVAVNSGEPEKAKVILNHLRAIENVVSYMNNQAVAMSRCERVEDGINRYHQTLAAIPDSRPDIKATVQYNLGLAMVRAERLQDALVLLKEAAEFDDGKVSKRAKSLLNRVKIAIGENSEVQINTNRMVASTTKLSSHPDQEDNLDLTMLGVVELLPGDLACFLVFQPEISSEKAEELMKNLPRFNFRQAIKRGNTGGAERLMQSS